MILCAFESPNRAFFAGAIAIVTFSFLIFFDSFILGDRTVFHDSTVIQTSMNIVYDRLFSLQLPAWNFYMNSGQPLWPQAETVPYFDPVSILTWWVSSLLDINANRAFALNIFIWLVVFAIGLGYLTKEISGSTIFGCVCVAICMLGPIGLSSIGQTQVFLLPHRYAPLLLIYFVKMRSCPNLLNSVLFSVLCFVSLSGYQTPYLALFMCAFASVLIFFDLRCGLKFFLNNLKRLILPALALLFSALPLLVTAFEISTKIYSVPHQEFNYSWFYPFDEMVTELFSFSFLKDPWHGAFYLGPVVSILIAFGFVGTIFDSSTWHKFARKNVFVTREIAIACVICCVIAVIISCQIQPFFDFLSTIGSVNIQGYDTLLGVRHWGSALVIVTLFSLIISAFGLRLILSSESQTIEIFAGCVWFSLVSLWFAFQFIFGSDERTIGIFDWLLSFLLLLFFVGFLRTRHRQAFVVLAPVFSTFYLLFGLIVSDHSSSRFRGLLMDDTLEQRSLQVVNSASSDLIMAREFSAHDYVPFHYERPTLTKEPFALFETKLSTDQVLDYPITSLSYQFKLKNYQQLVERVSDDDAMDYILGVGKPLVSLLTEPIECRLEYENSVAVAKRINVLMAQGEQLRALLAIDEGDCVAQEFLGREVTLGEPAIDGHSIRFRISSSEQTLIKVQTAWDENWIITINGVIVPAFKVNGTAMALLVPPGESQVLFNYRPIRYLIALIGKVVFVVFLCLLLSVALIQNYPPFSRGELNLKS